MTTEDVAKVLYEGLTGESWEGLNDLQKLDCLVPLEQLVKAEREDIAQWLEIEIELSGEISSNRALVYVKQLRGGK